MALFGLGIVEADAAFGQKLVGFFQEHGIPARLHEELTSLLADLSAGLPGMVVLGAGGEFAAALAMLRRIREVSRVPCILLVGQADARNEVLALEAGADGMIDRALPLRILLARIRAVLRRQGGRETARKAPPQVYRFAGWTLDGARRRLIAPDDVRVELTTAEFNLLLTFVRSAQRVLTREQLIDMSGGEIGQSYDRSVDILISRLRRKMEDNPRAPKLIQTIRSGGYQFVPETVAE